MNVSYKSNKVEKLFSGRDFQQVHGPKRARLICIRLAELEAANCLYDFWPPKSPPGRCHELTGGQRGQSRQLSVDLDFPYRLIFVPNHDPLPLKDDGGLDWKAVTRITILGVEDTHG
jgi:proteic killer suppression protein